MLLKLRCLTKFGAHEYNWHVGCIMLELGDPLQDTNPIIISMSDRLERDHNNLG